MKRFLYPIRRMSWVRAIGAAKANMIATAYAYAGMGLSLILQPGRWSSTPAYRNILVIAPQLAWGIVFLAVSALLGLSLWRYRARYLVVTSLTLALMVTSAWDLAFFVRWLTSPDTTPATWIWWSVFGFLTVRSILLLDYEEVRVPRIREGDSERS